MPYDNDGKWLNTGKDSLPTQQALNVSLGYGTRRAWMNDSSGKDTTNTFFCIVILEDTTFAELTDGEIDLAAGVMSSVVLPAGIELYGEFTGVEVSSGTILCYA